MSSDNLKPKDTLAVQVTTQTNARCPLPPARRPLARSRRPLPQSRPQTSQSSQRSVQEPSSQPHPENTQHHTRNPMEVALQRFQDDYRGGQPLILPTPGHQLWCFMFAIQRVFASRFEGRFPIPRLATLYKIFRCIVLNADPCFMMDNRDNFRVDQGAMVVYKMGKLLGMGNVQLGIYRPKERGRIRYDDPHVILYGFPGDDEVVADYTIWLAHTGALTHGHYSAMAPQGSRVRLSGIGQLAKEQSVAFVRRVLTIDDAMIERHKSIVDVDEEKLHLLTRFKPSRILALIRGFDNDQLARLALGRQARASAPSSQAGGGDSGGRGESEGVQTSPSAGHSE